MAEARSILEEQRRDASLDIELLLSDGGRAVEMLRWDVVINLRELETRLTNMLADPSLWLAYGAATALELARRGAGLCCAAAHGDGQ